VRKGGRGASAAEREEEPCLRHTYANVGLAAGKNLDYSPSTIVERRKNTFDLSLKKLGEGTQEACDVSVPQ
jgi:hypothetical protein